MGIRRGAFFRLFRYELRRWHHGVISNERQATSSSADSTPPNSLSPASGRAPGWHAGLVAARRVPLESRYLTTTFPSSREWT